MNGINPKDLLLFLPEILIATSALVVLATDLILHERPNKRVVMCWLSVLGLGAAAFVLSTQGVVSPTSIFFDKVAIDPLGQLFKALFISIGIVSLICGCISKELPDNTMGEYNVLLLFITFGLCLMGSANDLLTIYLGVELVSIVSFAMAGFRLKSKTSSEAALKYVIYGGAASGIMLFGISMMYGLFGTTALTGLNEGITTWAAEAFKQSLTANAVSFPLTVVAALSMVLVGIGYKIAVVPFHMWSPDVYEGAPTAFTGFLSVGPKAAGFALLMRFMITVFVPEGEHGFAANENGVLQLAFDTPIAAVLGIMAALTMTFGNFAAIAQHNVKRLLAYSSIAHAGYLLVGFVVLSQTSLHAVILYLVIYYLMNLGAFTICQAVRDRTGGETLDHFRNLGVREPLLGICMVVFLVSLTGLPPLAGFVGKFYLFASVLERGGFWLVLLAVVGVLNSAVSLYYYFKIVKSMYLETSDDVSPLGAHKGYVTIATTLATLTLVLGLYWSPVSDTIRNSLSIYRSPVATNALALENTSAH